MSQRSLIRKHSAETGICNLYVATRVTQNVVALYVTMQNLILVHCVQSKSDFLQRVLAELLTQNSLLLVMLDNGLLATKVHVVNYHMHVTVELVKLPALDQKLTVKVA